MTNRDLEHEQATEDAARQPAAPGPRPETELAQFASHVGNRAFGALMSRGVVVNAAGRAVIARQDDEEEDPGLDEGQKARLNAMGIAPLRAAANQLAGSGDKANVRSVIRRLTPIPGFLNAFVARGETKDTLAGGAEEVSAVVTVLQSLDLSHRQVIFLARSDFQTAKRHLAATKAELRRAAHPPRGQTPLPPDDVRSLEEGMAHVDALSQQIDATMRDLLEAPRTQEGFKRVVDGGTPVLDQFEAFTAAGGQTPASFTQAKAAYTRGLLRMMPLAMGREAALAEAQSSLQRIANDLAPLAGAEAVELPEDQEEQPTDQPLPPAPSPNPLPPPPPPPPEPVPTP